MPGSRETRDGRVLAHRQQPDVPPDVLRSGLDLLAGDGPHELGVVVDLERAEALGAGVLGDQAEGRAAVAAHQAAGGTGRERPPAVESACAEPGAVRVMRRLPPHLSRVGPSSRAGRNWHLPPAKNSQAAVAGASSGRVPLPLWMSGTPSTVPSPCRVPRAGQDVAVSTRIVYTDLDGTMVGPRGSFWHTADRQLTRLPRDRAGRAAPGRRSRWCWSAAAPTGS